MTNEHYTIHDLSGLQSFAKDFAERLKGNEIITLNGALGAGKTTFARFLIQHLMGEEIEVPSPTFTLVQNYNTPKGMLYHLDLYRLEEADEIYELGWEDMIHNGLMLIEWAERIEAILPPNQIALTFTILDQDKREIRIND